MEEPKRVTFGQLMVVMGTLIIPLIIWGVSVETRFKTVENNKETIQEIKKEIKENGNENAYNFKKLYDLMVDIKVELRDKKDRDK